MCLSHRSEDVIIPLDGTFFENDAENTDEHETEEFTLHMIKRSMLIDYMKMLTTDELSNGSFITPVIAMKIIDYVYLLNRTIITKEMMDTIVHGWYKIKINEDIVVAFNKRTKTIQEVINLLTSDCGLQNILMD